MAREPDLTAYFWWQTVTRKHPGGLMPKADAARVLGMSQQGVDYRTYSGRLRTLACPAGRDWLIADEVIALASELALEKLQVGPTDAEPSNLPTVRDLLSSPLPTADNTCSDVEDSQNLAHLAQSQESEQTA